MMYDCIHPTRFDHNYEAILNFPVDDPGAQIKSINERLYTFVTKKEYQYSYLYETTVSTWRWANLWWYGTALDGTVKVIDETSKNVIELLNKSYQQFNVQLILLRKNQNYIQENVQVFQEKITNYELYMKGIENIFNTYHARYANESNKLGLVELKTIKDHLNTNLKTIKQCAESAIIRSQND